MSNEVVMGAKKSKEGGKEKAEVEKAGEAKSENVVEKKEEEAKEEAKSAVEEAKAATEPPADAALQLKKSKKWLTLIGINI